jgi:hypothetical protein
MDRKTVAARLVVLLSLILAFGVVPTPIAAARAAPGTIGPPSPAVLIALPWDDPSIRVPAPPLLSAAGAATAAFSINYLAAGTLDYLGATCFEWDPAAQAAFSYAAEIWAGMITSGVPIRIDACWASLANPDQLAYSGAYVRRDFSGAPMGGTWYDYPLADALAGSDIDPSVPDVLITYNRGFAWYFGTDGLTPSGQYDFVTVALHEIGHGLGFDARMRYGAAPCGGATSGCWGAGSPYPAIYDRFTENAEGEALLNTGLFPNPSVALGSQLTGGSLYFDGPSAVAANAGSRVRIYGPTPWAPGSSYTHLDYLTFKATPNRLMVYSIPAAASIHDPGPVGRGILKDLGWDTIPGNPAPAITGLSPSFAPAGGAGLTLTVNGAGFVDGSVVQWNGSDRTTAVVSGEELSAEITAADIAGAGVADVTVVSPPPGGGTSKLAPFRVAASAIYLPLVVRVM